MHQHHEAIRRGLLKFLELPSGCIALRAGGFDVPARLLVFMSGFTTSIGDFGVSIRDLTLELPDPTLQLMLQQLESQLELPDAISRNQALGEDVLALFLVGVAQESQLIVHQAALGSEDCRGSMRCQRYFSRRRAWRRRRSVSSR
jgi:hypothetical protein